MYNICYIFLLFLMYSFLGWLMEVILFYIEFKKLVNRGFLIGPYCPIYGIGVLLIINLLKDYTDSIIVLFVMSMFICMILEYFTSFIMEKLFKARWWDYSNMKFNINGRICLEFSIPFGIGGLIIMYLVNPIFNKFLNLFSDKLLIIIGVILMILLTIDMIISLITMLNIRNIKVAKFKDNTEEINKKVKDYLMNKSILTRRLMKSFPTVKLHIYNIKSKIDKKVREIDNKKKH